jgi:hypothetical protein
MHFNGIDSPPSETVRQVNVDEIVKGFVLQSNGKVRITAQLIDPALGTYVWTVVMRAIFATCYGYKERSLAPSQQRSESA